MVQYHGDKWTHKPMKDLKKWLDEIKEKKNPLEPITSIIETTWKNATPDKNGKIEFPTVKAFGSMLRKPIPIPVPPPSTVPPVQGDIQQKAGQAALKRVSPTVDRPTVTNPPSNSPARRSLASELSAAPSSNLDGTPETTTANSEDIAPMHLSQPPANNTEPRPVEGSPPATHVCNCANWKTAIDADHPQCVKRICKPRTSYLLFLDKGNIEPLSYACEKNKPLCVSVLVKECKVDHTWRRPIPEDQCFQRNMVGDKKAIPQWQMLENEMDPYTALCLCVKGGYEECLRQLLQHPKAGEILNQPCGVRKTILHYAIQSQQHALFRILLQHKDCTDNLFKRTDGFRSILGQAIYTKDLQFVRAVLEQPRWTLFLPPHPSSILCLTDSLDILNLFLEQQACKDGLNEENYFGNTPLISAAKANRKEVLERLLAVGCDPNFKNKKGETALTHAKGECKDILMQRMPPSDTSNN